MDEATVREILRQAVADEPPIGRVAANSLREGLAMRRRRRAWRAAGGIAAATAGILLLPALTGAFAPHVMPKLGGAGEPKFLITSPTGMSPLRVHDAATGAVVSLVTVPGTRRIVPDLHTRRHFQIDSVATADGRTYVVGLYRAIPCTSRLYQFTLSAQGTPGPVTPFAALPVIRGAGIGSMAFSASGRVLAFSTISGSPACSYHLTGSHIGIVNLATKKTTQWSGGGGPLSLDFDGTLLAYGTGQSVMAMPTSAPPGPAARYSRTLIRASQFGRQAMISFAAITPDGKQVCFNVFPETSGGPKPGQIRCAVLGSGRSRLVASDTGYNGLIAADPRVRHLLFYIRNELVKLDLRTGKVTPLPPALRRYVGETFW